MNIKNHIGSEDISTSHNLNELESDTLLLQDKIKSECNNCYREVLEHMRPEQIVQGIKGFGFDKMKWTQIQKHTARPLMVQLCTNILGERTKIDSDHGERTKQDVKDIQSKLGTQVDGDAGKDFFSAVVAYIQSNSVQTSPQKNEQQIAKTNPVEPLPPRKSENIKSNESDKRTLDALGGIREDLAGVCIQLFPRLENVHADREKVTPQIAKLVNEYQQNSRLTPKFLDVRIHMLYHENKDLEKKPKSQYTRVGQVGTGAWIDGFKRLGINNPPPRNKTSDKPSDIRNHLKASMGYLLKMYEIHGTYKKALATYNLGSAGIKSREKLKKQAIDMLQKVLDYHNISYIPTRQKYAQQEKNISYGQLCQKTQEQQNTYIKEYNVYIRDLVDIYHNSLDEDVVIDAQSSFYTGDIV